MTGYENPFKRQHRLNTIGLLMCAGGIGINILLNRLVSMAGIPLYLDTVGTVIVAAIGGYLPGVIVGFATNVIEGIFEPASLYYGVINVLIAVLTSWMAGHGWLKKPVGIIASVSVFSLIGGCLGAVIPMYMEGVSYDSESLSAIINDTGLFSTGVSHFLSTIIMDFPDKAVTVFLALLVRRLIPEKFHPYFELRGWKQTPLTYSQVDIEGWKGWKRLRSLSLGGKIVIVFCMTLVVTAVLACVIGMTIFHRTITAQHSRIAEGTARIAAGLIDGDQVNTFLRYGEETEGYAETYSLLNDILTSSTDIAYLYVYQIEDDGCHIVFDIAANGAPVEETGTVIPLDSRFGDNVSDLLAGRKVDPIVTKSIYGHMLTAYEPVYDSTGLCVCYVGTDVDIELLFNMERSFLMEMICIFLGFFIPMIVFILWLIKYDIIIPVNTISECVDGFADEEETQEAMDEDVRAFRRLNIRTGDEIERLYQSLCRMTVRQSEQMRSIRRLSDSTAKMQDGLIITMADMVENRDSDTGAHIQKTAAYVRIIVEGLKKKGYYTEKITPKFMSDVVRSAPLHDVGKINIPDEILNKPGKLTDEEYEIMKKHTTAGKKIMENAISTVEGENYLKEARNMAAYHHERWDGKGYPEGLHGEVIPLSARIMAVADVFDALASPRVYKPAFPLDKALSIIEEGKGTQFDPKCVEAFMDSLDEVKLVLSKYSREA